MELIRLLINSVKTGTCFMCFKESEHMQNIHEQLEIKSQFFTDTVNLVDIINYLFPSFDMTLTKACKDCSELLIRMYIVIHRNNILKKILKRLINTFNNNLNKGINSRLAALNYPININLSKIMDVKKKAVQKYDIFNSVNKGNNIYDDKISNKSVNLTNEFSDEKQCPHCCKMFSSIKQFKNHIKNHGRKHKKIYFNCSQCDYKSLCKDSLQGHINKCHLKMRPHVCKICYKNFYHKKNLVEHQTRHAPARNDICEFCGETFIHKKNLLEHLKLHSGEKPYICDICGKRYITSGRRLEHIKRCHRAKNECCLLCDKKFSLVKELTRHMKTVHS